MTRSRFGTLPNKLVSWDGTAMAQDGVHLSMAVLPCQRQRSVSIFIGLPRVRALLKQHFCHTLATVFRGQVQWSRTLAVGLGAIHKYVVCKYIVRGWMDISVKVKTDCRQLGGGVLIPKS